MAAMHRSASSGRTRIPTIASHQQPSMLKPTHPSPADSPPRLSVVVACFNEEAILSATIARLVAVCRSCVGNSYELVLINDGSTDGTWDVILSWHSRANIVAADLSRNFGHQAALTAGLHAAAGERVLTIDADLQDPPELIEQMMQVMDNGYDVVYGQRVAREGETVFKRATASVFYRVLRRMSDTPLATDTGDFRLMTRRVRDAIVSMPEGGRYLRGMIAWVGFRQSALSYVRAARGAGTTKFSLGRMIGFSLDAVTGFSVVPLRLALIGGAMTLVLSALYGVYSVYVHFTARTVPGWTSLVLLIVFTTSVQLIGLGIIGEYVGRLFLEQKQRPLFLVRDRLLPESPSRIEPPHPPST